MIVVRAKGLHVYVCAHVEIFQHAFWMFVLVCERGKHSNNKAHAYAAQCCHVDQSTAVQLSHASVLPQRHAHMQQTF